MAYNFLIKLTTLAVLARHALSLSIAASNAQGNSPPLGRREALTVGLEHRYTWNAKIQSPRGLPGPKPGTLISTLWGENSELVNEFMNVQFLKMQAEGKESDTLQSYQYYSVQDYYYLVDFVKYQALRMTTYPEGKPTQQLQAFSDVTKDMRKIVDYSNDFRSKNLMTELKIPVEFIDDRKRSDNETNYAQFLHKGTDLGWFTMHVMSIPCVYGWGQIATKLDDSKTTNKDTVFYRTWIEPNSKSNSGQVLSDFLEVNKAYYASPEAMKVWTQVFRQAMQFEINFFNDALEKTLDSLPK